MDYVIANEGIIILQLLSMKGEEEKQKTKEEKKKQRVKEIIVWNEL